LRARRGQERLTDRIASLRAAALFPGRKICLSSCSQQRLVRSKLAGETAWRSQAYMRRMKILVTGAAGFICGYLVAELLEAGHEVVGVDNFSKYGPVKRSFDSDPRYRLVEGDAKDVELLTKLASECDHILAGAAIIGGLSYSHA